MAKSELAYRSATFKREEGSELDQWRRHLVVAAKVVERYGDKYLPIFERAEQEIAQLERKANVKDRVKAAASLAGGVYA